MTNPSVQAPAETGPDTAQAKAFLDTLALGTDANLIGLLQQIQDEYGYLPAEVLAVLSGRIRVPLSRIYGVVSFYAQFYTEPRGRHTVKCCSGTACHVKGGQRVLDCLKQTLDIDEGQTTGDMLFYLETVACLGTCFLAPVMMIDDQYYGNLDAGKVDKILDSFRADT